MLHYYYGPNVGWFGFGVGFLGLAFWAVLIWAIIMLLVRGGHHHTWRHFTPEQDPLAIAKARYARGEITKDEFDQIKKDIS